ncbi:biotin--[acetyl-CoA-carboxylase] ligase [Rubrolithibacter danxiaensis]|uniref:biotin--[acetyl-CoA-carboxylase] ligase n=1 Tax=Rubrolithibacter danxiaensis TaxID=3390805 RepID=UPI003BF81970
MHLPRVDSTNNYLKYRLSNSEPLPEGTVILADEQYAGRGQINNNWLSEPGKNLTFSILFTPSFIPPQQQFLLNKVISIGINDALCKIIGDDLRIKWPNDIFMKNKKLGGVLIENIVQGSRWKYAIAGIGINVNQAVFPETIQNVTSISQILQRDYDLKTLLGDLCKAIEVRYLQLRSGKFDLLHQEYVEKLYRFGEDQLFRIEDKEISGKIMDVDEDGSLKIQFDNSIRKFGFKEIAFVI